MRYFIVDDDTASRKMLQNIIMESGIGLVVGEANSGVSSLSSILAIQPDFVLIDLLMPELDGMETIKQLKEAGFTGQFIMISQVVNKEMVGEAYSVGVEFFIHKPINKIEVASVLNKTKEQFKLKDSLIQIRESLVHITPDKTPQKRQNVHDIVISILNNMGIIGEPGSDDLITMVEIIMEEKANNPKFPALKYLYEAVAVKSNINEMDLNKEGKAIEQRIRRTISKAIHNLAILGSIDYTNPEFEYYAPRYFDFQEVRNCMIHIQEESSQPMKTKVNIRKFLHALYLETFDRYQ